MRTLAFGALIAISAACLAAADNLVVAASFLDAPDLGGWLLAAGLAACLGGIALRMPWLVFAAQNGVLLLSSVHAWHDTRLELGHAVEFAAWMLVGNLLVWPLALWAQRRNAAKHAAGVIRD
ncbi:hypothetical protein ACSBM8_13495 [Sphingomonas sp. ASY06-1R]|uniref:hypothetical protein n=1 Tax=Sphingomonas sp. ASY06-1R TaxID=3445771 RepID=UPI003FA26D10